MKHKFRIRDQNRYSEYVQENTDSMDFDTLIAKISERYENSASRKKDLGTAFERVAKFYLASPKSLIPFKDVWMWQESGNPLNPEGKPDMGIDLVAKDEKDNIWTVQVKEHIDSGEEVSKGQIDSFFAKSEACSIPENRRILMLFGCDLGKNSRKEIDESKEQPVLIYDYQVKDAGLDWTPFLEGKAPNLGKIHMNPKGDYQRDAVEAVVRGLETADKGKLIMACGTGKTWVSLRAMEKMAEGSLKRGGQVSGSLPGTLHLTYSPNFPLLYERKGGEDKPYNRLLGSKG